MSELVKARVSVLLLCCSLAACRNAQRGHTQSDDNSSTAMRFVEGGQKMDAGELVDAVLFDSDLYTNSRSREVDPETREKLARREIAAGFSHATLVVLATVVDRDRVLLAASNRNGTSWSERRGLVVHVEKVLAGKRVTEELRINGSQVPSAIDPTVFPYHVKYVTGSGYYFFLNVAEELSKESPSPIYTPIMSVPKQR